MREKVGGKKLRKIVHLLPSGCANSGKGLILFLFSPVDIKSILYTGPLTLYEPLKTPV